MIQSIVPLVENLKGQNAEVKLRLLISINWFQKLRKMYSIWQERSLWQQEEQILRKETS
jgi:hypothetical protein